MPAPFSDPGTRPSTSSLSETFGQAGRMGELGENLYRTRLNKFADDISNRFPSNRYEVRHGLDIPRGKGDRQKLNGDVDFAVASGSHLVLIDAKKWRAGLYWSIKLPPRSIVELLGKHKHSPWAQWLHKHALGRTVGLRWIFPHVDGKLFLSENMAMALERYRAALPGVTVSAMVVFVPKGDEFLGISFLRWPGEIPTFKIAGSYGVLYDRLGVPSPVNPAIANLLNKMNRRS
jgi:hypothetical protein